MQEDDKLGESKISASASVKEEEEEEVAADKEVVVMMMMDQNRAKKVVSNTVVDVIPECDVVDDDVDDAATDLNFDSFNGSTTTTTTDAGGTSIGLMGASIFTDFKDGSSDSDSSAIFNEDNNHNNNNSPHNNNHHQFFGSGDDCGGFHFSSDKAAAASAYQPQFVKIEEHNFFSDESCSTFFRDDQPPTLQWDCCPDDWN